jgi:carboxymethylenebutenolidase
MPATTIPRPATSVEMKAHLAVPPTGDGPWPGVVVLHEAFGLNDDVRDLTGRMAAAGYVAIAPDLYTDGGARRCLRATFSAALSGDGKAFDDIDAAREWVAQRPDCTGRVGVIGFCMGGGFALFAASRGFDAAAPNYGRVPGDVDALVSGACPIVASFGARDLGLKGASAKLAGALERAGVAHDVKEYPGAGHSFMSRNPFGPLGMVAFRAAGFGYHEPSAEDAWGRILRFFEQHLRED